MTEDKIILGAHYYPWYGKTVPPILGFGEWEAGVAYKPQLGFYNSKDEAVIAKHVDWAKKSGIDFFAMEWSGPQTFEDSALKEHYLLSPRSLEMEFCIHYDSSLALNKLGNLNDRSYDFDDKFFTGKTKGQKFVEDIEYLADNYFNHPKYLKIKDRPVLILYDASAFRNNSRYFDELKVKMEKKGISLFLVADAIVWPGLKVSKNSLNFLWNNSPKESLKVIFRALRRLSFKSYEQDFSLSRYFQAIAGYNLYHESRTLNFVRNVDRLYKKFWEYAKSQNINFIPGVMTGFNDRNLKGLDRPILERQDGEFYKNFWGVARKYIDPELRVVLLTTFNEWHEGTAIEPCQEFGDKYLELTKLLKK